MRDVKVLRSARARCLRGLALVGLLLPLVTACGGNDEGDSSGGVMQTPGVQATISSIQRNIFTPKCALSGCHTGPTPQPLGGPGLDLSTGQATAQLINVASTLDPAFQRVLPRNVADSYLYMKITGDPRIGIAVPGSCSVSTGTACSVDGDCPAGEICDLVGVRMPKNGMALSPDEIAAIGNWIAGGSPTQPGY